MLDTLKLPVLSCFLVGGNQSLNKHIIQLIQDIRTISLLAICEDKAQQHACIAERIPDVIFWDKTAIVETSADCLRKLSPMPQVIVLSETDDTSVDLPDYVITTAIKAPFERHKFETAMNMVADIQQEKELLKRVKAAPIPEIKPSQVIADYVFLRVEGRITRFDIHEILYFHGFGEYVMLHSTRGEFRINTNMKALGSKLEHPLFLKTHRAFVINVSKIDHIEENEVIVGKNTILISRAHRADVRKRLNII